MGNGPGTIKWDKDRLLEIEKWRVKNNASMAATAEHFDLDPVRYTSARNWHLVKKGLAHMERGQKAKTKLGRPRKTYSQYDIKRRKRKEAAAAVEDFHFEVPDASVNTQKPIVMVLIQPDQFKQTMEALWR